METRFQIALANAGFWLACVAAATIPVSVAASHAALGLAFTALALSGRLRFPPALAPIIAFFSLTLISLVASPDPPGGWPQVRKFFVWLMLIVVFSTLRNLSFVQRLLWAWAAAGAAGALWSFVQFYRKWARASAAGENFYMSYVGDRITGFMSHWMTFSAHMMIVLLLVLAILLWSRPRPWRLLVPGTLVGLALILAQTRGIWVAAFAGALYLIGAWRPRLLGIVPLAAVIALMIAPPEVRERAISIVRPHGNVDSNQHRIVCWRTGWEMIKSNPLLGVGPERVKAEFDRYVPRDIQRPLPSGYYAHLHSIYVHYAAERGVPALAALLWLFIRLLWDFTSALRGLGATERVRRAVLHGAIAVIIAVMISGVTETNLGDSEVLAMFLATAACGYSVIYLEREQPNAV